MKIAADTFVCTAIWFLAICLNKQIRIWLSLCVLRGLRCSNMILFVSEAGLMVRGNALNQHHLFF